MILTQDVYPRSHQHPFYLQHHQQLDSHHNTGALEPVDSNSIASSPHSTLSHFSNNFQQSASTSPLSTTFDVSRRLQSAVGNSGFRFPPSSSSPFVEAAHSSQSLSQVPDLMPSTESWLLQSQQQSTPRAAHRLGHNRESSLSSLNSNGPASPYNPNTSNPHIAVTDASGDGYQDLAAGGDSNYSYQLGKPSVNDNFYATLQSLAGQGAVTTDGISFVDGLHNLTAQQQKPRLDRSLLSGADLAIGSSTRSHPASVASSTVGGDSPATPSFHETLEDDTRRRKNNGEKLPDGPIRLQPWSSKHDDADSFTWDDEFASLQLDAVFNNTNNNHLNHPQLHPAAPPKLDRTMTDVYNDELYNPNFTITSASPPPQTHLAMSPSNELFSQVLKAANSQHLSAVHSPVSSTSRINSPFRQGSPLAPSLNDFAQQGNALRLNTAQQLRERQKQERDAKVLQQHMARNANQQQGTPSTISPKDAMLEFNDTEDASNFPLFPPQDNSTFGMDQLSKVVPAPATSTAFHTRTPLQTAFDFSMPTNIHIPQQYPFVPRHTSHQVAPPQQQQHQHQQHQQQQHQQQQVTTSVSAFSRLSSADTNGSDISTGSIRRPTNTNADTGTYTCTYHGCNLRFDTPALLQKHKREGHRQANALGSTRTSLTSSPGVPDSLLGSQAGPHRCDRINPSTGKSCNTVFSRPYDLTRHEDTIHNARKKKVRCNLCTEEKTFSRADALTRHYRVCHPDVEFPGKHRRRGGATV
ncbi:hypothetical protein BX600DRAFT_430626 [Xylariales sp. PMI_506]|nr:hypothetical protein BX600DRAFT_430626 [Xylariales sp. PMI_506]